MAWAGLRGAKMPKTENNYLINFWKNFAFLPIFAEKLGRDRVTAREIGSPRHERVTAVNGSTPRFLGILII